MAEQVGPKRLLREWRKQSLKWMKLLPQLPVLLHNYLQKENQAKAHNQALLQLLEEQRQTNVLLRRLLFGAIGFIVGVAVVILMQRLLCGFLFL